MWRVYLCGLHSERNARDTLDLHSSVDVDSAVPLSGGIK